MFFISSRGAFGSLLVASEKLFCPSPGPLLVPERGPRIADASRRPSPHSLGLNSMLCFFCVVYLTPKGASTMEWVTPQHEEVDLNCEVGSYANAEL